MPVVSCMPAGARTGCRVHVRLVGSMYMMCQHFSGQKISLVFKVCS
jgi:hypothetical protein